LEISSAEFSFLEFLEHFRILGLLLVIEGEVLAGKYMPVVEVFQGFANSHGCHLYAGMKKILTLGGIFFIPG
jgi:hypothetical protein